MAAVLGSKAILLELKTIDADQANPNLSKNFDVDQFTMMLKLAKLTFPVYYAWNGDNDLEPGQPSLNRATSVLSAVRAPDPFDLFADRQPPWLLQTKVQSLQSLVDALLDPNGDEAGVPNAAQAIAAYLVSFFQAERNSQAPSAAILLFAVTLDVHIDAPSEGISFISASHLHGLVELLLKSTVIKNQVGAVADTLIAWSGADNKTDKISKELESLITLVCAECLRVCSPHKKIIQKENEKSKKLKLMLK